MKRIECPPHPACLVESMRNVGYSMETAVADIIDNSIAAGAKQINIFHSCEDSTPILAVVDDGHGMTHDELIEAMRAGGRFGPMEERAPGDMGRFGLGLKTASFSQCRRLTVASRKHGQLWAACWDLDELEDSWSLSLSGEDELVTPWIQEMPNESGTMVLWEKMDRVAKRSISIQKVREHFLEQVEAVRSHLGLVFHRFIEPTPGMSSLGIMINRLPVEPFDPYFRTYTETQKLETETISVRGSTVTVNPFIIPHYSKLRAEDKERLQAQGGAAGTQGFYVYRNRRLLAWGNWFRLRRAKTEASGLARVMIDIPNALDDLWSLDIKKSNVSPPEIVRQELRRIIERITDRSTRTYTSRGQRLADRPDPLWQRIVSNKDVHYVLNRHQTLLKSFITTLSEEGMQLFDALLLLIERNLPVEAIHNDSQANRIKDHTPLQHDELIALNSILANMLRKQNLSEERIEGIMDALNITQNQESS